MAFIGAGIATLESLLKEVTSPVIVLDDTLKMKLGSSFLGFMAAHGDRFPRYEVFESRFAIGINPQKIVTLRIVLEEHIKAIFGCELFVPGASFGELYQAYHAVSHDEPNDHAMLLRLLTAGKAANFWELNHIAEKLAGTITILERAE